MNAPATVTRRLEFDAAHRLLGHEGKCRNYHGHRYRVEVTCRASQLDAVGRVIDFSVVKNVFGKWVDDHFDHGFLAESQDDPIVALCRDLGLRYMVLGKPPTAENISEFLFGIAKTYLGAFGVDVVRVRLYETPNCWADFPNLAGAGGSG